MATPLVHRSLRDNVLNLRLVKLHPATDATDTLKLDVEEHTRASAPPYEALSYAWGTEDAGGSVSISNQTVAVSETVETALRHLRLESVPRWLWIDQLCINQADDAEKSHQVGQMHLIYAEAIQALAWLGPGNDEVGFLFHKIRETVKLLAQNDLETLEKIYQPTNDEGANILDRVMRAFDDLCARSYWARVWIVQEFTVARHVVIVCGKHSIDANKITRLFLRTLLPGPRFPGDGLDDGQTESVEQLQLRRKAANANIAAGSPSGFLRGHIHDVYMYQTLRSGHVQWLLLHRYAWWRSHVEIGGPVEVETRVRGHESLLNVMDMSQVPWAGYCFRGATDDRDRVFAMLNLALDKEQFSEFPDYSISAAHTYYLVARRCLELGHHKLLAYNQFPKRMDSLPSWVPDWSGPNAKPMLWQIARSARD
ncbi:heterokaryon incompatibility protein-domain-containing protein [Plectosphaerella plurivora]|uniref:Heterokaryon incompatibility protein-domain-containing protein n=1 Tax=Plectosphaerella plurivora TaxID=936078 RepID=A0A9P9A8K4_9PEZI|nr:heterokaryon incompatibility protein-domain-containing protein [Plectosphaerella plurivora]